MAYDESTTWFRVQHCLKPLRPFKQTQRQNQKSVRSRGKQLLLLKKTTEIAKKKHNRHQHNTDDGGQAMGEELIQMYR